MSNETLMREWQKKLPGRIPEGQELSAFAVGVEVGLDHARKLEREDWSRVHHVLFKHGVHPGRTDDHLADVIDKALAAPPAPAAVPLLTDAQVDAISMGLFGCINAAYRKQITDAVLSSGGGGITCATKRTVAQVRTATSAAPAAVPLTEEVLNIHKPYYSNKEWPCFKAGVSFAEMVHGIAAGDKP